MIKTSRDPSFLLLRGFFMHSGIWEVVGVMELEQIPAPLSWDVDLLSQDPEPSDFPL